MSRAAAPRFFSARTALPARPRVHSVHSVGALAARVRATPRSTSRVAAGGMNKNDPSTWFGGGGEDAVFMEAEQTGMQTLSPADLDALLAGVRAFQHILGLFFSFLFCVYKHVPVPLRQSIPAIAGVELASAESAPQVRHCLKQSTYANKWIKLEQLSL